MPDHPLFYAVWVSNSASRAHGTGLMWSRAFDTPAEAKDFGRARVEKGEATMAFVVRMGSEGKKALVNYTYPASVKKIVQHWLDLEAALR